MALGAGRAEVFRLVLGDALRVTSGGIALGLLVALATARALGALLFGIGPADAATLVVTCVALILVATLASVIPARRATAVDPIGALRRN